ncbi:hypothetical protein IWX47DRAFT_264911 [Phyllosticta citricarpa]
MLQIRPSTCRRPRKQTSFLQLPGRGRSRRRHCLPKLGRSCAVVPPSRPRAVAVSIKVTIYGRLPRRLLRHGHGHNQSCGSLYLLLFQDFFHGIDETAASARLVALTVIPRCADGHQRLQQLHQRRRTPASAPQPDASPHSLNPSSVFSASHC